MTFDIYTNRVPFGLLDAEEQAALKAHPGPWEYYTVCSGWTRSHGPVWYEGNAYRAVRAPEEPLWIAPEVWAVLDRKWQWAARDENGVITIFDTKPILYETGWDTCNDLLDVSAFAPHLIRPGTVAWDKSLISRPEGV
jgi:hypothetical protein